MNQQAIRFYESIVQSIADDATQRDGHPIGCARDAGNEWAQVNLDGDIIFAAGVIFASKSGPHQSWSEYAESDDPAEVMDALATSAIVGDVIDELN